MTAPSAPLCGHRWHTRHGCAHLPEAGLDGRHCCELDAGHAGHAPHLPRPHACRCGATTTREDAR